MSFRLSKILVIVSVLYFNDVRVQRRSTGFYSLNCVRKMSLVHANAGMVLRSYDTFRNLSLIFLKFCQRKDHSTVIFKNNLKSWGHQVSFFFTEF